MKFFVTHGQGIEPFVHNELMSAKFTKLFNVEISKESNFHGKVIFSAEAKIPITVSSSNSTKDSEDDMLTKTETSVGKGGNSTNNDVDDELENRDEGISSIAKHFISNLQTVERIFGLLFQDHIDDMSKAIGVWAGSSLHRRDVLSNLHSYISKMSIKWKLSQLLDDLYELQVANEHEHEDLVVSQECKRLKKARSFRVNAKVSGKWKRILNPNSVAPCIGSALVKSLCNSDGPTGTGGAPWEVNLRNPTLEISVYLTDDGILSGVSLENIPLSNRSYLNKIPLRSTVAYCMGSLAVENSRDGKEGDTLEDPETGPPSLIVLDPMCGSSVILIELVKYFPQVLAAFGIDNDRLQVEEATQNIKKSESELSARLFMILGDSTKKVFPFRDNLVFDAVVCDLPFGIQHSYTSPSARDGDDGNILPLVLSNIDKVVKHQGNIIILISLQMNLLIEDILSKNKLCWTLKRKYPLKLGELPALICHYKK